MSFLLGSFSEKDDHGTKFWQRKSNILNLVADFKIRTSRKFWFRRRLINVFGSKRWPKPFSSQNFRYFSIFRRKVSFLFRMLETAILPSDKSWFGSKGKVHWHLLKCQPSKCFAWLSLAQKNHSLHFFPRSLYLSIPRTRQMSLISLQL